MSRKRLPRNTKLVLAVEVAVVVAIVLGMIYVVGRLHA